MSESNAGSSVVLLGGAGLLAYLFWPQISSALGIATAAPASPQSTTPNPFPAPAGTPPGTVTTNLSPSVQLNANGTYSCIAAATQLPGGCCSYAGMISCPPGISPPPPAPPAANCQPGFTVDQAGICTQYTDADLLAGLNSIQWSGSTNIPTEQINRIDPQILAEYSTTTGVDPGSVLAYMLGLGGSAAANTTATGSDGNIYEMVGGMWIRQPSAALSGIRGTRLGAIAAALPVTNQILMKASHDPETAAILGNDPRGLLTVDQWNYFYALASGQLQTKPTHPQGAQGGRVNAQQYQSLRMQAGVPVRLGSIRRSAHPGAFYVGYHDQRMTGISNGPSRQPFVWPGNRNIYRIPGQGAVPAKLGLISSGGGQHRWSRSPFPRPAWWRQYQGESGQ